MSDVNQASWSGGSANQSLERENVPHSGTVQELLSNAIDVTEPGTLRALLKTIVTTNAEARKTASLELLVPAGHIPETEDLSEHSGGSKRKIRDDDAPVMRYAICEKCDQQFDVSANNIRACEWHEGTSFPFVWVEVS